MPHKSYFIISLLIMFVSLVFVSTNLVFGLLGLVTGLMMLVHWNTISYKWKCGVCGTIFDINAWQNFWGINGWLHKRLFCPQCQKSTWCKGVPK